MARKRQRSHSDEAASKTSRQKTRQQTEKGKLRKKPNDGDGNSDGDGDDGGALTSDCESPDVAALEVAILALLRSRKPGASCCPSEVPRRILGENGDWRSRMPVVREAAARLFERGELEIMQKGVAVMGDPRNIKGPIRLKLVS